MKRTECIKPAKGLECTHNIDWESACIYCELDKCEFKKINYKNLMTEDKTVNGGKPL